MLIDERFGWFGGTVLDLATKDQVVLAATLAGIYRSADGGQRWQRVGNDLPDQLVQAIALTKDDASNLAVAASNTGWLYLSHDHGENWEISSSWRNVGSVTQVAVSPDVSKDGIVLACTGDNGIFKSTDHGRTWKAANFGLLNLSVLSVSFSPNFGQDEVILAGTDGGGLFRSRNAARAWRELGKGLPDSTVQSIAFSPSFVEDGTIFVGTDGCGLYRSTDKARTWAPGSDALAQATVNSIVLEENWASGGQMLIATDDGVWISVDAGISWYFVDDSVEDTYALVQTRGTILTGSYEGIYRSHDGYNWRESNVGLAAHLPPLAAFSDAFERDQTLLMASMDGDLVRTQDGGGSWAKLSTGLDEVGITALDSTGAGKTITLFAATDDGLIRSQDSGDNWTSALDLESPITALSISDTFTEDGNVLVGTGDGRVLVSEDSGVSWQQVSAFPEETVVAVLRVGREQETIYVVTARQMDATAWTLALRNCDSGKVLLVREAQQPTAVLHDSPDSNLLFCALGSQVLCLQDEVIIAESEMADDAPVSCLIVDDGQVIVGTRSGLCISNDNGKSWNYTPSEAAIVTMHTAASRQVYAVEMGGKLRKVKENA